MGISENYNSITAKYDVGWGLSFSAELGHQIFQFYEGDGNVSGVALPDYTYGNVGFSYTYKSLTSISTTTRPRYRDKAAS